MTAKEHKRKMLALKMAVLQKILGLQEKTDTVMLTS